jgi:hypothetical protein
MRRVTQNTVMFKPLQAVLLWRVRNRKTVAGSQMLRVPAWATAVPPRAASGLGACAASHFQGEAASALLSSLDGCTLPSTRFVTKRRRF